MQLEDGQVGLQVGQGVVMASGELRRAQDPILRSPRLGEPIKKHDQANQT